MGDTHIKTRAEIRGGSTRRKEALVRESGDIPESQLGPEMPSHVRPRADVAAAPAPDAGPDREFADWHYEDAPVTHMEIDGEEVPVRSIVDPKTGVAVRDEFQPRGSGVIEGMISDPAVAGAANPYGIQQAGARLTQDEPERDAMLEMLATQARDPAYQASQMVTEMVAGVPGGMAVGPGIAKQAALAGAEEGFRGAAETGTLGGAVARGAAGAGVGLVGGAIANRGQAAESLGRAGGRFARGVREGMDAKHAGPGMPGRPKVLDDAVDALSRDERIRQRALALEAGTPLDETSMAGGALGFRTQEQLDEFISPAPRENPIFSPSTPTQKEIRRLEAERIAAQTERMRAAGESPDAFTDTLLPPSRPSGLAPTEVPGQPDLDAALGEAGMGTMPGRPGAMDAKHAGPGMSRKARRKMERDQAKLAERMRKNVAAIPERQQSVVGDSAADLGEDPAHAGMRLLSEAEMDPPARAIGTHADPRRGAGPAEPIEVADLYESAPAPELVDLPGRGPTPDVEGIPLETEADALLELANAPGGAPRYRESINTALPGTEPPAPRPSVLDRARALPGQAVDTGAVQRFGGRELSRPAGEMMTPLAEQLLPESGMSGVFAELNPLGSGTAEAQSTPVSANPSGRTDSIVDAMSQAVGQIRGLAPGLHARVMPIVMGQVSDPKEIADVNHQLMSVKGLNWSHRNPMRQDPDQ